MRSVSRLERVSRDIKRLTLRSTVETGRHEVVVLPEPRRAVPPEVELREDGDTHRREDGRVDADGKVTEAPAGDGRDELVEAPLGEEAVGKVEGKGHGETDDDRDRNDEVGRAGSVHVLGERSPCDGLRVERLNLLSRPNVGTLNGEEDLALVVDDRLHDDELKDGADDGTDALNAEGGTRRKFGVLTHLQVAGEGKGLSARVVSVEGEVQVGLRVAGNESGSEHLSELLNVGFLRRDETSEK